MIEFQIAGGSVLINVKNISHVENHININDGCYITLIGGGMYHVDSSYDEVKQICLNYFNNKS